MGDGVKWAEECRPSMKSISDELDKRISRKIQNIFVQDIQNDCDCNTETYDSDLDRAVYYVSENGIKTSKGSRIPLLMNLDISEKDVSSLLEEACKNAGNEWGDLSLSKMLYNPASDGKKMCMVFEKYVYPIHINRSGDIHEWIPMDWVPEDCVYLIPDPEYFGVISANIGKFGAFCFANNIIKVDLKSE